MKRISMTRMLTGLALCAALLLSPLGAGTALAGTFTDDLGRTVKVPDDPQRIITLVPSLTEVVYALGLGDRMVGSVSYSYYPPEAAKLPLVGDYMRPNLERIAALNPDLVLAFDQSNPTWVWERLTALNIPVYISKASTPEKLARDLAKMGVVLGRPEAGRRLAEKLKAEFSRVARRLKGAPPRPTLMVVGSDPIFSVGKNTLHDHLITMAHGINVAAAAPGAYPQLNREFIVAVKPQVVVLRNMGCVALPAEQVEFWKNMPGLAGRPDYRVEIVQSDLIDRPGPRLGQGLEALARAIHPERFQK